VAGAWPGEGVAAPLQVAAAWSRFAPIVALSPAEVDAAAHGRGVEGRGLAGAVLLVDGSGEAVAVAREEDGVLRVQVGLRG
jgi:hypothetical protein